MNFPLSHNHMTVGKSHDHVNLWTYDFCFVLSTLTITPTWPKMVVSQMPHNWDISNWQRTWCKSVECARIYPPLISVVGVVPPPIHLLCWESFVFLLFITVKVRASFTSSTWFLICLVVLWLQCLLLPLWPTQCCICHIASLHQCLPSVLADMPLLLHPPCHLTTNLTLDLWKVACGLQWWSLHSIACLYCYSPMLPHYRSDPGSMEGGLWAAMVEPS